MNTRWFVISICFTVNMLKLTAIATASAVVCSFAAAQTVSPPERVEVTGSLIKRTDRETPSVVEVITKEDIRASGYATVEEFLKSKSYVDNSSIQDGYGTGFVSGISTYSLRGFGSQGTLVLINGRRIAPVAAVDINFGRGSLISVNALPQGAIDRVEVLKDGASAMYGSDAMAGVVNYVLKREYEGAEISTTFSANDRRVGPTKSANLTFGFGGLDSKGFNVFGGLEVSSRGNVLLSQLTDRGRFADYQSYLTTSAGSLERFSPSSVAALYSNYYSVPTAYPATRTLANGEVIAGNSSSGPLFLGSLAGCPADRTVGKGVPTRLPGYLASTPSMPNGMCRYNTDNDLEYIAAQDRLNGSLRGTLALNKDWTAYADVMLSKTKTVENFSPYALTTTVWTASTAGRAVTWPLINGTFLAQSAIVLPATHPDNPTRGTANAQPVQLLYRFEDIPQQAISDLQSTRFTAGLMGTAGAWDIDAAVVYSKMDNSSIRTNRILSSGLTAAIGPNGGAYRFGQINTPAAISTIAADATVKGSSSILSTDVRASRDLFRMPGGNAAMAVGAEFRREELSSVPDANYQKGDYIGLVANGTSGSRDSKAAFAEFRLPVMRNLEGQLAARTESYSDFGNSTTGKAGFKWDPIKSTLSVRGTLASGFRAPSISQISNSYLVSFHSNQDQRVFDPIRCNSSNPASPVSLAGATSPFAVRDCNVLGFSAVGAGQNPGNLPTVISANPDLKPETSRSATFGFILSPNKSVDLSLDYWQFDRYNEIRVQRGLDIMNAYIANQSANAAYVLRDSNPATWLPGVANSGPILALVRQYGNFNFTSTNGLDYDLSWRLMDEAKDRITLTWAGTRTFKYDQQILSGTEPSRYVNTAIVQEVPKNRYNIRLEWRGETWGGWTRVNHIDAMRVSSTSTCETSTSTLYVPLRAEGLCMLGAERTLDLGANYRGIKNLVLTASVLNLTNSYARSVGIPNIFTYWDLGTPGMLGRRFSVSASYDFK
ncbi:MAG: TonB-dependent receptor [Betaproteobacteria bacterium]|nr:TonB-dependent receptor [Betaproteobacteria bacterium]NBU49638.1 TonB-dependent receptor [Betaproteobacteria bacterium]